MLSPDGVTEKTNQLYLLTDTALLAESELIHSDIVAWILDNFETTEAQHSFLNSLNPDYLDALGEQAARAVRHRWPIIFKAGGPAAEVRSSKWIRSKEDDEASDGTATKSGRHIGRL